MTNLRLINKERQIHHRTNIVDQFCDCMVNYKLIKFLLILLYLFLLCSCDKSDKQTIIKGLVSDFYSNNPIRGYNLMISRTRYFNVDAGYAPVEIFKTDSNGIFLRTFNYASDYGYALESDSNYFYSQIIRTDIVSGKRNDFNFKVKPYNILKLDIRNKTQKYKQIWVLTKLWSRWTFNDTIVYITQVIPEDYFNLEIYLYKIKFDEQADTILRKDVWIEHKDTSYYKIEL